MSCMSQIKNFIMHLQLKTTLKTLLNILYVCYKMYKHLDFLVVCVSKMAKEEFMLSPMAISLSMASLLSISQVILQQHFSRFERYCLQC